MKKTISFTLGTVNTGIDEIERFQQFVAEKTQELTRKLAEVGLQEASFRFASAMYDGTNDSTVELIPSENGYTIMASGQAVCFIEFGAGVYYNGSEPYPNPRPPGVVGIGEYGYGLGKLPSWSFSDGTQRVVTHGNPAAMPMWYATKEMEDKLLTIAKEVFT